MFNIKNRNFLNLSDFTKKELTFLLDLAIDLKKAKYMHNEAQYLKGKNIALIFQKDSTRTRSAFEVACYDQGANVTYIGPVGSPMGKKESIKDTARVLGRMYDGIEFRGYSHSDVEDLGKYSGVPVFNGLTDKSHPTQMLADFMTMIEHGYDLNSIKLVYCGDGRNNVAHSLMIGSAIMGVDFRMYSPKELFPDQESHNRAIALARESGGKITISDDINTSVSGANCIYTDVWVSMGEDNWEERIKLLTKFQVNKKLMEAADSKAIFLHCLPAFHDRNTEIGEMIFQKYGMNGMEVTDDVFESKQSVVFDQAENRLHTIKAIMVGIL